MDYDDFLEVGYPSWAVFFPLPLRLCLQEGWSETSICKIYDSPCLPEPEADRVGEVKDWKLLFCPLNPKTVSVRCSFLCGVLGILPNALGRGTCCVSAWELSGHTKTSQRCWLRDLPQGWSHILGQCGSLGTFPEDHTLPVLWNPTMDMVQ